MHRYKCQALRKVFPPVWPLFISPALGFILTLRTAPWSMAIGNKVAIFCLFVISSLSLSLSHSSSSSSFFFFVFVYLFGGLFISIAGAIASLSALCFRFSHLRNLSVLVCIKITVCGCRRGWHIHVSFAHLIVECVSHWSDLQLIYSLTWNSNVKKVFEPSVWRITCASTDFLICAIVYWASDGHELFLGSIGCVCLFVCVCLGYHLVL